jgi:hypothetical protein
MRNAKEEFLLHATGKVLKCAEIALLDDEYKLNSLADLPVDYTQEQLEAFLKALDIRYNDGYGTQELFGIIWYTDGTYSTRWEYDGSEGWAYNSCPAIPKKLILT